MESEVTKDVLSSILPAPRRRRFFEARIATQGVPVRRQLQVAVCEWAGRRTAIASCSTPTLVIEPPNARNSPRNSAREASAVVKVASSVTNLLESESESQSEPASWVLARDTPIG